MACCSSDTSAFIVILHKSLASMFAYCRCKPTAAAPVTLLSYRYQSPCKITSRPILPCVSLTIHNIDRCLKYVNPSIICIRNQVAIYLSISRFQGNSKLWAEFRINQALDVTNADQNKIHAYESCCRYPIPNWSVLYIRRWNVTNNRRSIPIMRSFFHFMQRAHYSRLTFVTARNRFRCRLFSLNFNAILLRPSELLS
jgi:hypothetical protein